MLAAAFPQVGNGLPAVSIGSWAGGRYPSMQPAPRIVAQVLGAIAAAGVL